MSRRSPRYLSLVVPWSLQKTLSPPLVMPYRSLFHDSFGFLLNKENHWIRREMCYWHIKDKPLWFSVSGPEQRTRAGGARLTLCVGLFPFRPQMSPKTIWAPSALSSTTCSEPLPDSPPERRCFSLTLNCLLGWSPTLGWKYFSTPLGFEKNAKSALNQTSWLWSSGTNAALRHPRCAANHTSVSALRTAVKKDITDKTSFVCSLLCPALRVISKTTFSKLSRWFKIFDLLEIRARSWTVWLLNADWTWVRETSQGQTVLVLQHESE